MWRKIVNRLMVFLTAFSAALGVAALLAVLAFVVKNGVAALNVDLLIRLPTPVGVPGGGVANAIVGLLL